MLSSRHSSCPREALEWAKFDLHPPRVLPLPPLRKLPDEPATKYPAGAGRLGRAGMLWTLQTGFGGYFFRLQIPDERRGTDQSENALSLLWEREKTRGVEAERTEKVTLCSSLFLKLALAGRDEGSRCRTWARVPACPGRRHCWLGRGGSRKPFSNSSFTSGRRGYRVAREHTLLLFLFPRPISTYGDFFISGFPNNGKSATRQATVCA